MTRAKKNFVRTIRIRVHNPDTVQESLLFLSCIPQECLCATPDFYEAMLLANRL